MRRRAVPIAALAGAALGWSAGQVRAQQVRVGAEGVLVTYSEITKDREVAGTGIGGRLEVQRGKLRLVAHVLRAGLSGQSASAPTFDLIKLDLRAVRQIGFLGPLISVELGIERRWINPEFAAQDVGTVRVGVLSEVRLGLAITSWVRGALIPVARFNGGGSSPLGVELGFGTVFDLRRDRLRAAVEYELQRLDRTASGFDVPIQVSVGRFGLAIGR